ncbi:MAG: hypothetical protein LBD04_00820 [Synergistaceae bacterium]|nr:hypothetical protein [Synergistaceae bacterium]
MSIKKMYNSLRYKNSQFIFYAKSFLRYVTPSFLFRGKLEKILASLPQRDQDYVLERVDYYNKMKTPWLSSFDKVALRDFRLPWRETSYFFDAFEYTRFFPNNLEIAYQWGDITDLMPVPTIVKSRPIHGENATSVLLKLNKNRHFVFVKDKNKFQDKKDMLIGANKLFTSNRIKFWEMYSKHPRCEVVWFHRGNVPGELEDHKKWVKPFVTVGEQLKYKFILCLEGHDVATNLKWVMSSNSLAVMPRPTYETWFMEGKLIPNYHYVEIKPDYSDLIERMDHYASHPKESLRVIENANKYVEQFQNHKRETLISLLVLKKYFNLTAAPA